VRRLVRSETLDYTKAGTVLYRWAIKRPLGGTKADMVKPADEASAAGPRETRRFL
jgi:hypothetical protein